MLRRSMDSSDAEELGKVYDHSVMVRLSRYLAPYKKRAALALFGMILFAASSYVQPLLIGIAFSHFIAKGNIMGLNILGLVFVGLAIVGWGAQYLQLANTGFIGHRV